MGINSNYHIIGKSTISNIPRHPQNIHHLENEASMLIPRVMDNNPINILNTRPINNHLNNYQI